MSAEENKALIRKWYDCWNKGDWEALYALHADNFVDHNARPGLPPGIEGMKQDIQMIVTAVPGSQITLSHLMADGDKVIDHGTLTGTNTGPTMGIPPSGKPVRITATNIWQIQNGKIVAIWHVEDILGMMQQIGAIPSGADASSASTGASGATARPSKGNAGSGMGVQA
jgi:steroid delta-isomerase-like uncharacterized protein